MAKVSGSNRLHPHERNNTMTVVSRNLHIRVATIGTFFLWIVGCVGCATLESDSEISPYGPSTPGEAKSGRVSYNPHGLKELVNGRRSNALKKIYKFCGNTNEYQIIKEEKISKEALDGDSLAIVGASEVQVIHFACNKTKN